MSQLAVFPSDAVARWIDAEWLEREPSQSQTSASRRLDSGSTGKRFDTEPELPRLRYRPFERLSSVYMERTS